MASSSPKQLPYGRQTIDDADVAAVMQVLRGDWLTTGPAVDAFEAGLGKATNARYAVSCANGTAGLHLASLALHFRPGDAVIVPAVTFLATASAPHLAGADVIFADVDPATGLMRAGDFEQALSRAGDRKVRAVFPVHLAGQCEDLATIRAIARSRDITVVDDACHALGTRWGNATVGDGQYSDMSVFSFHPVKTITTAEGGAVTTNDPALFESLRLLRNHGMQRDPSRFAQADMAFDADGEVNGWYYEMAEPGLNYRLSDIQAALGTSQLAKLDRFVATRRALVADYDRLLKPLAPRVRALARVPQCIPAWHLYVVLIDFAAIGCSRGQIMKELRGRGINTQVHYVPLPMQPYWRARSDGTQFPGAGDYYARALTLPLFPAMTAEDVKRVVDALTEEIGA